MVDADLTATAASRIGRQGPPCTEARTLQGLSRPPGPVIRNMRKVEGLEPLLASLAITYPFELVLRNTTDR